MLQLAEKSLTYWNNKGGGPCRNVLALCMSGLGLNRRMDYGFYGSEMMPIRSHWALGFFL